MKKFVLPLILLAGLQTTAQQVSNFNLVNVVNGQSVSLESYSSGAGVVVLFTSNVCPYDEYYRTRIDQLSQAYKDRVPVLLVNSNIEPAESNENMAKKAQQLNLTIPYLADKEQVLMTGLNAHKSPEAFLLKNNNGKFSIVYRGAIDDNAQVQVDVRHPYLQDAIEAMLAGRPIVAPEVRPVGCNLKKK